MANRYWVGGTGNWSDDDNHWATSSGGSGGNGNIPTSSDNVIVDANSGFSGGGTISVDVSLGTSACLDFTCSSGHSFTLASVNDNLQIYGSLTLEAGVTTSGVMWFYFLATSTGKTITQGGATLDGGLFFNGAGGGWTLQDDIEIDNLFLHRQGTFDANDHNVTAGGFDIYAAVGKTVNLLMGSGTWTATVADMTIGENYSWSVFIDGTVNITPETSTIKFTDATSSEKSFWGSGKTYNNLWLSGAGTGVFSIWGSNTFNNFKVDTPPHTVKFEHGTTQTVSSFTVSGTSGNLITINSETTATHALTKSGGGTISCDYLNIQHSVASPANTWYAGTNSTNNQGVSTAGSGWIFTDAPVSEIIPHLRSMMGYGR